MRKKLLISLVLLTLFLAISSVSASENTTQEIISDDVNSTDTLSQVLDEDDSSVLENSIDADNISQSDGENDVSNLASNSNSKDTRASSKLTAPKAIGYTSFNTKFIVKLTAGGKKLANKKVSISIKDKTYNRLTNAEGQAILNVKLPKGNYRVDFSYNGDKKTKHSSGTSKITVKPAVKTYLKIGDRGINYRQGLKSLFFVKLTDVNGRPLKSQTITFKVAGKKYVAKTTRKGNAHIFLSLKKGNYNVYYSFSKKQPYLASKGSFKIHVSAPMARGNGYWMWPSTMSSTDLGALAKRGTKHIFLESYAVSAYGSSYVTSWIKKAHSYGMKVHLWMCICSDGENWVSPVRDDGSFKFDFINKKVADAVRFVKMAGVDGIHLDYMRYGGTAHKHINADASITYIVKKISYAVHKAKPNAMVSVALMPEPEMMHYYYGQDVSKLSRYADALIPMVYKGNYAKDYKWIYTVTKTFVKQSKGAQIWTGLQAYKSDNDVTRLPYAELFKDAKSAINAGAKGIVLFRIGISNYLNFKKL